jgi:methyltransferase OMS1
VDSTQESHERHQHFSRPCFVWQVLRQAASLCKPDGQILLLQHGRSSWDWWNQQLDTGAQRHKQKWGCYWNRDIERICAEAGLQVDSLSRWHFGTTYIITARPLQSKVHVSQT